MQSFFENEHFENKRVLLLEDFNVPFNDDRTITDNSRILAAIPTLKHLIKCKAKIGVMSHLGRPNGVDNKFSLDIIATELEKILQFPVKLVSNDFTALLSSSHITLFENVRFLEGETTNDSELAKRMAKICDIFVMDAFATSHREHASTCGVAEKAPLAIAGPLLEKEISNIKKATDSPEKPLLAIIGGAKISSKLPLLTKLVNKVDHVIIGGGMANTCLKAMGYEIGNSLYEQSMVASSKTLIETNQDKIILPSDVLVTKNLNLDSETAIKPLKDIATDDVIADIGNRTSIAYQEIINNAKTIIWNGPVGIFEMSPFMHGTKDIANAVANSHGFSIAGGGDTIAAINKFNIADNISYISTGGGAFLDFLQNQNLPGLLNLKS